MQFRLIYRGPLKTHKATTRSDRQAIRRCFHKQLQILWQQKRLDQYRKCIEPDRKLSAGDIHLIHPCGPFKFAPLVSQAEGWFAVCDLNILFLRPSEPGQLVGHGGDLDNRLKCLLDALRMPTRDELDANDAPTDDEIPFHCLLEDDALVTGLEVVTDRLLIPVDRNSVELVIRVNVRSTQKSMGNDPIW